MFGLTPFYRGNNYMTAYNPFKEIEELERKFFERQTSALRTDIRETENSYVVEAELPGFSKENINIEIKNGYLTISAERKSDEETKDEKNNYIRRERSYGSFTRTFDLSGINEEEISASYKDGILSLNLPKAQTRVEQGRRLEIK